MNPDTANTVRGVNFPLYYPPPDGNQMPLNICSNVDSMNLISTNS